MSATTIVKWACKELRDEVESLLYPEAKFVDNTPCWSDPIKYGRRISWLIFCLDEEKIKWLIRQIERFDGVMQVRINRMCGRRLDYSYLRIYIQHDYYQKRMKRYYPNYEI